MAINENIVPDRLFNQWEALSDWQMAILIEMGMMPEHCLIDIGCGPGRLAVKAIPYLASDHYFGVDPFPPYTRIAVKLLEKFGIRKKYWISEGDVSKCNEFPKKINYAMAASVFTHMSATEIIDCLHNLKTIMSKNGVMVFTHVERQFTRGILYGGTTPMYYEKITTEDLSTWLSEISLKYEFLDVPHPSGQRVGVIRF